jgi:hypothetical protein
MTILSDLDDNGIVDAIGTPDPTRLQVRLDNGAVTTYLMKNQKGISGIAVNDFNGDGVPDVIVSTSSDFEFFPGLGFNGLLADTSTTITAPHRDYKFLAAMDVNHDGKPDLVFADLFRVSVKLGHGDGTFDGATTVYDSRVGTVRSITLVAIGNFDGDTKGDIAVYEEQFLADGSVVPRLTILYGDGKGGFTQVHTPLAGRWIGSTLTAADVDADGRTDLLAWSGTLANPVLEIFHGKGSRTMTEQKIHITSPNERLGPAPVVADFDGDGINDLAYLATKPDFSQFFFTYLLGQTAGFALPQTIALTPNGNNPQNFAVGELNGDNRPDWMLFTSDLSGANTLDFLLNTNFAGKHIPRCGTAGRGSHEVAICSPLPFSTVPQNTRFSINSHAFLPITRLEIWVDGKKVHQTNHSWSEINIPLTPGPHRATAVAVTIDGDTLRQTSNFTVQ